jgi:hypothetical protein
VATKVLSIGLTTSGSASWTAEEDYTLVGCMTTLTAANVVVSFDAAADPAKVNTPTSNNIRSWEHLFAFGATQKTFSLPVKIPILKGRTLLISSVTSAVTVFLYLDPPEVAS